MYFFISYTSADLSKVVDLATLCTFLTIGLASPSGYIAGTTIAAALLHGCFWHVFAVFCQFVSVPLSLSLSYQSLLSLLDCL